MRERHGDHIYYCGEKLPVKGDRTVRVPRFVIAVPKLQEFDTINECCRELGRWLDLQNASQGRGDVTDEKRLLLVLDCLSLNWERHFKDVDRPSYVRLRQLILEKLKGHGYCSKMCKVTGIHCELRLRYAHMIDENEFPPTIFSLDG